jgi:predicted ATPase
MTALPTGTVTFLFTDIEGSTRLLQELGDGYAAALADHRRVLREAFAAHHGVEVDTQGDAFFVAFSRASDALAAAREVTEALDGPIRVRIGIHTGEPVVTEEGYVGIDVHRAARIAAVGHGGQILLSNATRELCSPEGLRDLGRHRLKDLTAAERIFQLGDHEFAPLKSLNTTNLPVAPNPLVGRTTELTELSAMLVDGERLVTLTGPGGSGKTRLALQVGAELLGEFPGGVFFVPLASLDSAELVRPAIARTVGVPELEEIADRRALLLLDNFEHVLDAAQEVACLLQAGEAVRVLATSRAPLRVHAEREYAVEPLPEHDGVELLIQRARSVRRDFVPSPERAAKVCRQLDGLPLALELAAGQLRFLDPDTLLARLEQRLPLLTGGARDAPERQQTLRATIEWSFDLLPEELRQVFARLAVFAGTFSLDAAESVVEAKPEEVRALVEASLVKSLADSRFLMLETIREFALELLVALEQFWTLGYTEEGMHWWKAFLDRGDGAPPLLRARVLRSFGSCAHFAGDLPLAEQLWEQSVALYEQLDDEHGIAVLLHRLSICALEHGDVEVARERAESSLSIHRRLENDKGACQPLSLLGSLALAAGDVERGSALLRESAALATRVRWRWWRAGTQSALADVALAQGRSGEAKKLIAESLGLALDLNDRVGLVWYLAQLAHALAIEGDMPEAGRIWGAVEAAPAFVPGGPWPRDFPSLEQRLLELADPDFEAARAQGRGLTLEEVGRAHV